VRDSIPHFQYFPICVNSTPTIYTTEPYMQLFATELDRLAFLLETDAACHYDELLAQAAELVTEELPEDQRPKYITNYIGSKQKLVDWIWKHTPDSADSVIDAFSGSGVVAYMYKTKGLRVLANDRLRYSYHAARAIVEIDSVRISQEELDALLADNPRAGTFVRDNFNGIFFASGVHGVIDEIRANVNKLEGFKKDIALLLLAKPAYQARAASVTSLHLQITANGRTVRRSSRSGSGITLLE